jgi:hypothetical protein
MSINKNFIVRHGFEASTNLILADADTRKVGVGTTAPQYTLHVNGGIGATDLYVSGIGTFANELNVGLDGTVLTVLGLGNSIGIGTALPAFLLDVRSPVSTGQTALYVQGDVRITGDLVVEDDLVLDEVTTRNITVSNQATTLNLSATGIGTITTLNSTSGTITNLTGTSGTITTLNSTSGTITNLTGTSGTITTFNSTNGTITNLTGTAATIGTVKIVSGIITATSGIVTFFGDGQYLDLTLNASTGIGIGTTGGVVGYGITFIDFYGAGVSTTFYNSSVGIATIFFEGGGGGGTIGIGTEFPASSVNGDLFFSAEFGRLFIYYDENIIGVGTDEYWIDAAPFNVGIITALTNVSFSPGSALAPSMFFVGDNQTGFFSPGSGQFTVVSSGSSVLNVNASGINVTGVVTATSLSVSGNVSIAGTLTYDDVTNVDSIGLITARTGIQVLAGGINVTGITTITNASGTVTIGIGTTALLVEGNARVTGILTVGSSSITLNGSTNIINVGTGLTLSSSGINVTGVITATSFVGTGLTLSSSGINVTGVITATSFVGNGSGLTGIANTANIVSTAITTGILNVGTGITVNASGINVTGVVTATSFFGSGANLTGVSAGSTVFDDTTTNQEFFPLFTATTSGTITASGISTSKLTYNPSTGAMTAVDFNSTSDINLKENIHTVGNALEITEQLRGVSFDWKETGKGSYGVIAQELEEVLPELVKQGEVKSVNYNGIIGVLIEAIKELKKEVEDLKSNK